MTYTDPDGRENGTPISIKMGIPYDCEKKIIDREYTQWQFSNWPPKGSERTVTPYPDDNQIIYSSRGNQTKNPNLLYYHEKFDEGLINIEARGFKFAGEMNGKFVSGGVSFDVLDNYLFYNNTKSNKGLNFKFSLFSVNISLGIIFGEYQIKIGVSGNAGVAGNYAFGKDKKAFSFEFFKHLFKKLEKDKVFENAKNTYLKKLPVLEYFEFEVNKIEK